MRGVHGSARPAAASEGACDCGAVARGAAAHSAWRAQPGFELACSAGDRATMPAMRRVSRLASASSCTGDAPGATLEDKPWILVPCRLPRVNSRGALQGRQGFFLQFLFDTFRALKMANPKTANPKP